MLRAFNRVYDLTDKGPLRGLSLIAALLVAGCVLWSPARVAFFSGTVNSLWAILLIWGVCSGVIHGSGLRLQSTLWRTLFNPVFAWIILLVAVTGFFV